MTCYHRLIADIETYSGNIMFQKIEKNTQTKINKDVKTIVSAYRILFPDAFSDDNDPYVTIKLNNESEIQLELSDSLKPYYSTRITV